MKKKKIILLFIFVFFCALFFAENTDNLGIKMCPIPGTNYQFSSTEVTQCLFEEVTGVNPSKEKNENYPVEMVSYYDAIYFCNELSLKFGYEPVYSIKGNTDILNTYVPFESNNIYETIEINKNADGFRLPTVAEWIYAAKGGEDYKYAGSNEINEIAIIDYDNNHEDCVAMKKPNGYGLFDMNGNVFEWTDDIDNPDIEYNLNFICGGSFFSNFTNYKIDKSEAYSAKREIQLYDTGIRLVRSNICKTVSTNLKLRSEGNMTSQVLLILSLYSKVQILEFGKSEIIDGMNNNWVKVEVISGKDRDGNKLKSGMTGWCYGGYLE